MTVNRQGIGKRPATPAQQRLLRELAKRLRAGKSVSQNVLAKALDKSPQAIGQMLERLERDGWIEREPGEAGRERPIQLVGKGGGE